MSNFQLITEALDRYTAQTGINLKENPLADKVMACDSPDGVLLLFQENLKAFKEYRDKNRKFLDHLRPVVKFVHIFSGVLGEAARMVSRDGPCRLGAYFSLVKKKSICYQIPFQPAKLIFVGIEVLFTVRVFLCS